MNKEKTVLLIKKENLFPNISLFKKINDWYWKIVLNKVKRIAKENYKNNQFMIVCDIEQSSELKEVCENIKLFEDYAGVDKEYIETYPEASKLVEVLLNCSKKDIKFEGYNLPEIIREEMIYEFMPRIDQINIILEIKKKEDVREFICFGNESSLTEIAKTANKTKVINLFAQDYIKKLINFLRKISLELRILFPFFLNNVEFIKTGFRPDKEEKILFAAWDITDFNRLKSLIEMAEEKEEKFLILATYRDLQKELKKEGISFCSLGDFFSRKNKKQLEIEKRKLKQKWKKLKPLFKESLKNNEIPLWEIFENEIEHFFLVRLPWIMKYICCCENLFSKNKINKVVTMGDLTPSRRSLIEVSKRNSTPSIGMQEGVFIRKIHMGIFPIVADFKVVWGRASRELLLKLGADSRKIAVCGGTRLDRYTAKREINPEIYKKLRFIEGQRFFLVATQPHEDTFIRKENMEITRKMIKVLKFFPEEALVFKLHPRESVDIAENILKEFDGEVKKRVRIVKEMDIIDLINASDIVFTINSTTGVESMILGKPLIILDPFDVRKGGYYEKFNIVERVTAEKQLIDSIKKSLDKRYLKNYQEKTKKFIEWVCYKLDGKATNRAFSFILNLKK